MKSPLFCEIWSLSGRYSEGCSPLIHAPCPIGAIAKIHQFTRPTAHVVLRTTPSGWALQLFCCIWKFKFTASPKINILGPKTTGTHVPFPPTPHPHLNLSDNGQVSLRESPFFGVGIVRVGLMATVNGRQKSKHTISPLGIEL